MVQLLQKCKFLGNKFSLAITILFSFLFLFQDNAIGQCTYSIALYDTYGDGWNGGNVTVYVAGTPVLSNVTLGSGYGPAYYNFTVSSGQTISVSYSAGSWSSENYYRVYDGASGGGTQLYASTMYSTPPSSQSITNGCSSGGGGGGGGCTYSIGLFDTYGDGWNGGNVTVFVDGVAVLTNVTLSSGYGPVYYNFSVTGGQSISVTYTAGSWSSENYFRVYDNVSGSGSQLYATTMYSTPPSNQSVTNTCAPPVSSWQSQFISMNTGSANWCEGETRTVSITVTNVGTQTWTNSSPDINIGVKWNAEADYFVRVDANGLAPGATQTYYLTVTAPAAGTNNLTFDVVNEMNCWFGNNNGSCGPGNTIYTSPSIIVNPLPSTPNPVTASPTAICLPDNSDLSAVSTSSGTVAGFTDYYAPGNWTVSHSPVTDIGSVNTSGAPNSISVTSSDGGNYGAHSVFFSIVVPASGNVSFNWNYTTTDVDGAAFDLPQYAIDGTIIGNVSGFNPNGANSQSGTATISLTAGQTFSFVMTAMDDILGAATTIFSNFIAPAPAGANIVWYTVPTGGTSIGTSASGANFPVSPSTTTTYYAEAQSLAGCISTPRIPVTVTVNTPSTAPTSVLGAGTFCVGNTITLTQSGGSLVGASDYQWYTGSCGGTLVGTGPSITVSPSGPTTYYVGTSANGACPPSPCVNGTVTIPSPGTNLGLNNESATCMVADNNWVHFYHSSGRLLASVHSGGQNLGNVTVTSFVDGSSVLVPSCDYPSDMSYATNVMQRHWVITPTIQPSSPVLVKLPFYDSEYNNLMGSANSNLNGTDDVFMVSDIMLTKYAGPLNVNSNALDNCPGTGGSGGNTLHSQAANGSTSSYSSVTGAYYTDFSIPGFSEFWLNGLINLNPLPITLVSLSTDCNETENVLIKWVTQSESNSSHFLIESSIDGLNWEVVGSVNAAGNSSSELSYQLEDPNNRGTQTMYYRLIQFDVNGESKLYGPVTAQCQMNDLGFDVFPNPASAEVTISIFGLSDNENSQISFCDVNGKEIKKILCGDGSNQMLLVDISDIATGCYIVRLIVDGENTKNIRWIKQ